MQRKYRGTVLVMVIGLLVMLFVLGTSFLFVSRFEKRMTVEMLEQGGGSGGGSGGGAGTGDSTAVLTDLLAMVRQQLRKDLVGADGIPYNGDLDGDTGSVREDYWDSPGWFDIDRNAFAFSVELVNGWPRRPLALQTDEIGDGLLAGNEPYPDPNNLAFNRPLWSWYAVSSFADNKPRLAHQVVQCPDNDPSNARSAYYWRLPWWPGPPNFGSKYGAETFRYDLFHTRPKGLETAGLLPDADGDGYPDFLFCTRDRASDNNETGGTVEPPAELWPDEEDWHSWAASLDLDQKVALRVISHGGMVLLDRDTPESLLVAGTDRMGGGSTQHLQWPDNDQDLDPNLEEVNLRRRNCLPPRDDPNDPDGPNDKRTEFERLNNLWLETADGAGERRWYPVVYDELIVNGGNNGDISDDGDQSYFEDPWMTPPTQTRSNVRYDRRHLVTTVSYDDLYRPNRDENGLGVNRLGDYQLAGTYHQGVLRRLGNSLGGVPYLPDEGLAPADPGGNLYAGRTQFSLTDLDETEAVHTKAEQLRLLFNYYRAMLHNTSVPSGERATQAAALAVNTWDYFDSDISPTWLDIGTVPEYLGTGVFGVEGLPFLSEIIIRVKFDEEDPSSFTTGYAVELFNPWPVRLDIPGGSLILGAMVISEPIRIPPADRDAPGQVAADESNLYVIATPGFTGQDRSLPGLTFGEGGVTLKYRPYGATQAFVIDRIEIKPESGAGEEDEQPDSSSSEWEDLFESSQSGTPGDVKTLAYARTLKKKGVGPSNTAWRFMLGIEQDVAPTPGRVNTATRAAAYKPIPFLYNNTGESFSAFPGPGALLCVLRYAHTLVKSMTEAAIEDRELDGGNEPITDPEVRVDNGHMPVFDQEQPAGIDDDVGNAEIKVPWGQLVFSYFTSVPLQRLDLDGTPNDYDGNDGFNEVRTTSRDYRNAYRKMLQRLTPAVLDDNVGLPVPLAERIPTANGYAYGPRLRGRINIGTAPWSVLEGIPLVQYFTTYNVSPVREIGDALLDIMNLADSPIESDYTFSPTLARAIVAYREARQVFAGEANYTGRLEDSGVGVVAPETDKNGDGSLGLRGRNNHSAVDPEDSLRSGPGFVTVGELANLVQGARATRYVRAGEYDSFGRRAYFDDSAHRIDGFDGTEGGVFDDYTHAIAILASLPDWLTVKSNTYTVYATVVDSADEVEATRGQWTVDRTRCLYRPAGSSAGLPELIGPQVLVNYADAADDPK